MQGLLAAILEIERLGRDGGFAKDQRRVAVHLPVEIQTERDVRRRLQLVDPVARLAVLGRDRLAEPARRRIVSERDVSGPGVPQRVDVVIDRRRIPDGEIDRNDEVAVLGKLPEVRLLLGAELPDAGALRDLPFRTGFIEPDEARIGAPAEE